MENSHLLAAPDSLAESIETILTANAVSFSRQPMTEHDHGRYVVELTEMVCANADAKVDLAIEKRRNRRGVDIMIIPDRRYVLWRDRKSELLAESLAQIFCQHGASDSPDVRCQDLG